MNKYGITFIFLLAAIFANGQGDDTLKTGTYVVIKAYEPTLIKANKINETPQVNDTQKVELDLNYEFLERQLDFDFKVDTIKAAKIKGEPLVKLYRGYLLLGMGTNTTPLAELFYNKLRSKKNAWGIHAKHFSSQGISSIDNSDFSENEFNIYGKKFTKKSTITGGIDFNMNGVNYYGDYFNLLVAQSDVSESEKIEQKYTRIGAHLGLENIVKSSEKIKHSSTIRFYNLQDNYEASENRFILDNSIGKSLDSISRIKMDINVDFNDYSEKSEELPISYSNTLMKLHPQFIKKSWDKFYWIFGGGAYVEAGDESSFRFYPTAELKLNLIDEILIPYAGFVGEVSKNSYGDLTSDNPFVSNRLLMKNTTSQKLYAGLRGSFSSKISFNANVSQNKMEDAIFYVKSFNAGLDLYRTFQLAYDDVTLTQIRGELSYQEKEKIKLFLIGEYFSYEMDQLQEAWHKPDYRVTITGLYDIRDKIVAKVDLFVIGDQKAKVLEYTQNGNVTSSLETSETLKGIVDANLGLEYRYTKKISAFVNFNNIASTRYERWQDYPTQRFNVLGGVKVSF